MGSLQATGWTVFTSGNGDVSIKIEGDIIIITQDDEDIYLPHGDVANLIEALTLASQSQRAVDGE